MLSCKKIAALAILFMSASLVAVIPASAASAAPIGDGSAISYANAAVVHDEPQFNSVGPDAQGINPGGYGAEFPRMLKVESNTWLLVYTIYNNNGYPYDNSGGMRLQVRKSTDNARTWYVLSTINSPGRDLDNGQILKLADGSLLMTYRSVRWCESYRIETRRSTDGGATWAYYSTVDTAEGAPGSLCNPQKGVYEPNMQFLPDGKIGLMYASEKHVVETPSYSQTISMKVSPDGGQSWGSEIYVVADANPNARPGMPVWTRMDNGGYVVTFELGGTDDFNVYVKTSTDGVTWGPGVGTKVPGQRGGPYVMKLDDGRLLLTSNSHQVSVSRDNAAQWYLDDVSPYPPIDILDSRWPAIVQTGSNEIAFVTSAWRGPGHRIEIRFGTWTTLTQPAIANGTYYNITAQHSGQRVDVDAGSSANGAKVQQYPANNLAPQHWKFDAQPDGTYQIVNKQSQKLLDVDANSQLSGAKVQQWESTGCDCQRWYLDYVGGGLYKIRAKHSGKLLDVTGGSTAAQAPLQQWPDIGERPQRWRLSAA